MIRARITNDVADLLLLLVRHVTTRATAPRTRRRMLRVRGRVLSLAGMARLALAIVEPTRERRTECVAIVLRMGIVTARARHAAFQITRTRQVAFLIRECSRSPIGQQCGVAELRESQRV